MSRKQEMSEMPITTQLQRFDAYGVLHAPNHKGVYALYANGELIYYGSSDISIQASGY